MTEPQWRWMDDLLEQADHLAHRDVGRPKQVSLRRSVSTAYYAAFHEFAFLCADELVGWNSERQLAVPIYRSLDHGSPKRLLNSARIASVSPTIVKAIHLFVELQEARHKADYDPAGRLSRGDATDSISQAKALIALIRSLTRTERRFLAVHLVAVPRRKA